VVKGWMPQRSRRPRTNEGVAKREVSATGVGCKALEAVRLPGPRELSDCLARLRDVGMKIQVLTGTPRVPCQEARRTQFDVPLQVLAGVLEQLLEDLAKREDGGPRVRGNTVEGRLAQFSARSRGAFEHGHVEPRTRKTDGARESPDAGPDDRNSRAVQPRPPRFSLTPLIQVSILHYSLK